ncbi:MAG: hypothetical protein J4224_05420 [Candidatus Diapherotrites archaeon]|uniref:Uncharacterized protein n=1 Tax=Candidatus Iainarchaeum sp. TaxID=3101447 RepID=A0A7J4ISS3_9ARCH|nr:MAG: hypothetical protein QT03_C0001G0571 [archaeon GW2011_AR10]MBS3059832.1 hypothetical protein [Candidatus Diapherotrites archaeon]HIH08563.1 hypothetical protein [Candidatus Diapherotrites archaeon]
MYDPFGTRKKRKSADRRAGTRNVPHVGKAPRARTAKGSWRKKRKDAGKKRRRKSIWGF